MEQFRIVKHQDLKIEELNEICLIKSISWNYDIKSQKEWIEKNLFKDDIHILLYENNTLFAYLTIVKINFLLNGKSIFAYGVGSVCSKVKNSGFGKKIIAIANNFIIENNKIGLLFCKDNLILFYSKLGWNVISNTNIYFEPNKGMNFITMVLNFDESIKEIIYSDRLF